MQLTIRPADLPQDYPAMSAVLEAENPGWGESAEELAYADATRDPRYHHATFVAEDELIGYSNLTTHEQGLNTEMTGVLPAYRGRGVATLLKLYGIRYAQAQNVDGLDTENDAVNHAMIALNQKLGFVQTGARLRFVKQMA